MADNTTAPDTSGESTQQNTQPSTFDAATNPTQNLEAADTSLDASLDHEISTTNAAPAAEDTSMNLDGSSDPIPPPQDPSTIANGVPSQAAIEPRIPQKKDATLRSFLGKMDDYAPLIPDAVTSYYLTLAGLPPPPETDLRLARLLALATQKFIADIAADAYQYSRIRSTNTTSNNPLTGLGGAAGFGAGMGGGAEEGGGAGPGGKGKKDAGKAAPLGGPRAGFGGGGAGQGGQGRTVLTMEDLGMAVGEYGVNVKRGEFYR